MLPFGKKQKDNGHALSSCPKDFMGWDK